MERSDDISEMGLTLNSGAPLTGKHLWMVRLRRPICQGQGRSSSSITDHGTERFLLKHTHPNCWVCTFVKELCFIEICLHLGTNNPKSWDSSIKSNNRRFISLIFSASFSSIGLTKVSLRNLIA